MSSYDAWARAKAWCLLTHAEACSSHGEYGDGLVPPDTRRSVSLSRSSSYDVSSNICQTISVGLEHADAARHAAARQGRDTGLVRSRVLILIIYLYFSNKMSSNPRHVILHILDPQVSSKIASDDVSMSSSIFRP